MHREIYQDKAGEWRWRIRSVNGNILADSSEGYKNQSDCRKMAIKVMSEMEKQDKDAEEAPF